jgi:hypothetical protein
MAAIKEVRRAQRLAELRSELEAVRPKRSQPPPQPKIQGESVVPPIALEWQRGENAHILVSPQPLANASSSSSSSAVAPPSRILRLTTIKVGTPQEALSIYCYLHQCAHMCRISKHRDITESRLAEWAQVGLALPRGSSGKAAHNDAWARMFSQSHR